jgi:flagellar biosynthesis protein FlhF
MPTYTFRGRDMSEAVEQVRNTLGSDAVIIDTLRGTDHIGRFVEITATGELKSSQEIYSAPAEPAPTVTPRVKQLTQRRNGLAPPPRSGQRLNTRYQPPKSYQATSRGPGAISAPSYVEPSVYQDDHNVGKRRGGQNRTNSTQGNRNIPPQLKGAERYVHPNSFSSQRDVIIPQPAPISTVNPRGGHARVHSPLHRKPQMNRSLRSSTNTGPSKMNQMTQPHEAQMHALASPLAHKHYNARQQNEHLNNGHAVSPIVQGNPGLQTSSLQGSIQAVQGIMGAQGNEAISFVNERLNEIVSYIQDGQNSSGIPAPVFDHLRQFNRQLQATGIERKYADQLIEETKARIRLNQLDKQVILAHLGQVLAQNIHCIDPLDFDPKKRNVLAFVGPTGVGKTTTIAKIAAHAHLTHEIPVTLISTDTFRMAAVEQLGRYAEILDCPSQAANTPEELWRLVDEAQTPLVLVDTTGRNPKVSGQLKVLSEFFGNDWQGRTVLTVAANTREQDLKPIVEGFSPLKYDMVAVTKLDETYALGTIYNVFKYTECPIAWMTNGQRVPEDIELANPESVAVKIIMEAISHKI